MSPEQYAERSTDRLLPLFVDYAKRLGLGRVFRAMGGVAPLDASIAVEPQEGKRLAAELLAIAVALGVRPTTPAVAALLRDDDPDVRMAAATFFNEIDPQLAEATRKGVMTGCSADEVIAMRERVRTPPPPHPTLQEMSDEALLARFEDAGERLVGCRFIDWVHEKRDMDTRNAILGELIAIKMEMKRRGMLARLAPFLDSAEPEIRLQAATGCLRVAPEKAVATLEALEAGPRGEVCAAAGWALDRWRVGECAVDKW
jgi:hypothetical protein